MTDKVEWTYESSENSKASDKLAKLGEFAMKFREQEQEMLKAAQRLAIPTNPFRTDMNAYRKAIESYVPERIIPEDYFEKTQEYQQKSLEVLQSINENTANLYTIVELISQTNEKQDELIALIAEILTLAKAKSKTEADSLFKSIMTKINETVDSADSLIKIAGWAMTVYQMVQPMLS